MSRVSQIGTIFRFNSFRSMKSGLERTRDVHRLQPDVQLRVLRCSVARVPHSRPCPPRLALLHRLQLQLRDEVVRDHPRLRPHDEPPTLRLAVHHDLGCAHAPLFPLATLEPVQLGALGPDGFLVLLTGLGLHRCQFRVARDVQGLLFRNHVNGILVGSVVTTNAGRSSRQ
eukprot:NODE_5884_length_629_cov_20.372414_g5487_i0.p1 GENE.NODE_5884_length_629_cov_20.372414_g5487_i0~~NODE_5884_length_629_cov_20.372414_g5487_i0.p1  ORF type:complete len:171 (+),score=3.16 NODE_5884_length_629_cov_20.372414_g5487_i0:48-560(+)